MDEKRVRELLESHDGPVLQLPEEARCQLADGHIKPRAKANRTVVRQRIPR